MTLLVRLRLPISLLTRLDMLGANVRAVVHKRVARAALMRALIKLALDTAVAPEVAQALGSDPVRRGRDKGCQGRRRR